MAEHNTPEPWTVEIRAHEHLILADWDGALMPIAKTTWTSSEQPYRDEAIANAERIVACVNFCAGTSSEYMAGCGNLDRVLTITRSAAKRNAELLAACQAALPLIAGETHPDGTSVWCEVRDQLEHAIASATAK